MNTKTRICAWLIALSGMVYAGGEQYTPQLGSKERKAICDGARPFVFQNYIFSKKLPQPLLFQIHRIRVSGNYCSFEAVPVFKNGTAMDTDYVMDIVFNFCLKKSGGTWRVIYDLSSTDVPSDAELKRMWNDFPKDFPHRLIPEFWRNHFDRVK